MQSVFHVYTGKAVLDAAAIKIYILITKRRCICIDISGMTYNTGTIILVVDNAVEYTPFCLRITRHQATQEATTYGVRGRRIN